MNINRRSAMAGIAAGIVAGIGRRATTLAQFTENEVRNDLRVTSTGDVNVEQAASGNQNVEVEIDGDWVSEDGIYRDGTSQVVVNEGRITSTGNVNVRQSASGDQQVTTVVRHSNDDFYDGMPADRCETGKVIASPHGVLYFQKDDCCFYRVPCMVCEPKKAGCEGDYCGGTGK